MIHAVWGGGGQSQDLGLPSCCESDILDRYVLETQYIYITLTACWGLGLSGPLITLPSQHVTTSHGHAPLAFYLSVSLATRMSVKPKLFNPLQHLKDRNPVMILQPPPPAAHTKITYAPLYHTPWELSINPWQPRKDEDT